LIIEPGVRLGSDLTSVKCNGEWLHLGLTVYDTKVEADEDGSSAEAGVAPEQASKDLARLGELIRSRQPEEEKELEEMHRRYIDREHGHHKSSRRTTSEFRIGSLCPNPASML
jgi:hypothetical protein